MNDESRADVLGAIKGLSEACPEYRLGQLVVNLALLARPQDADPTWNVEDEELLAAARKHLEDWRQRHSSVA